MSQNREPKKPHIKLMITRNMFNTLFMMFEFFVASEAQAGETFYSVNANKFMNQFVRFGNFIEKKHESDCLFLIYLYENEVMQMMKMWGKYVCVHQPPYKDFYADCKIKKG